MGSTLEGGVSRFMNRYSMPADNLMSANVVTAAGNLIHVSETTHPDLLWALRGAGANFGIVTSAEMNAHPTIDDGQIWARQLTYPGDRLEASVDVVNNLNLTGDMAVLWSFSYLLPNNTLAITAETTSFGSNVEGGRNAFQPLFELEPDTDSTEVVAYNLLHEDTNEFCEDGDRTPGWHSGLAKSDYSAFQAIWDEWTSFVDEAGLNYTTILVECYSNCVLRRIGSTNASYPHRDMNYYAWSIPYWEDAALDGRVETYASTVRDL